MPTEGNNPSFKRDIFVIVFLVSILIVYEYFNSDKPQSVTIEKSPESTSIKSTTIIDTVRKWYMQEPLVLELLGKAELSFAGGTEGRNKNIEIGIARINGMTVDPGEEFSFTEALGEVTAEEGYSEEKIFLNNEVTRGIGGGLCQVSTTLFQSAVSAGLPITERQNHTYSVLYYNVGLDATYSDPGPDLKFVNDTAYPITIKGRVEDQKAIFEIHGVPDGRIASTSEAEVFDIVDFPITKYIATSTRDRSEPECVNKPQIGYTAKVIYNVLYPDGVHKEQIFTSVYKPLQKICYILF